MDEDEPPDSAKRRILVVEDNPDARQSLQKLLELCGYEVESARDGLEGYVKALADKPDVIILDIGLPVLSGYEVAQALRNRLDRRTKLIALTAYCRPEDRKLALDAGFDVHLGKPADVDRLLGILKY